jgi:hypothetical protein
MTSMACIEPRGKWVPRKRQWITASKAVAIIALISTCSTIYFAWQNQMSLNSLYNLQNSIYNFPPFILSNPSTSILATEFAWRNLTTTYLLGHVAVDLKVITPYDGMLTINVGTLNFTQGSKSNFIDMNNLNTSETSPYFFEPYVHQYFVSKDVINSINDSLLIGVTVILKPNWISPNSTSIGYDLGNLNFKASLFAARLNRTIKFYNFTENILGSFTPSA